MHEDTGPTEGRDCSETVEGESSLDCGQCSMSKKLTNGAARPADLLTFLPGDATLTKNSSLTLLFSWAERRSGRGAGGTFHDGT